MNNLISAAVFLLISALVFAGVVFYDRRRAYARLLQERLAAAKEAPKITVKEELELLRDDVLSEIPALDKMLRSSKRITVLQEFLDQADLDWKAGNFLIICGMTSLFLFLLVALLMESTSIALGAAALGLILPYAYVSYRRQRRFDKFQEVFPDALDTLARAVRAGHAFTTALELVAAETARPVSDEFRKTFEEQKYGLPVRDALHNLARRVPMMDLKFFVTAVMLQRETGGNLGEILDNLAHLIRERFKVQRQVKTHTAQGRMTMMLLMMLPPAVGTAMATLVPDFVRPLFVDPVGQTLLVMAGALQVLGYILIRRVIRIQV
jgi:tight adherence protein B